MHITANMVLDHEATIRDYFDEYLERNIIRENQERQIQKCRIAKVVLENSNEAVLKLKSYFGTLSKDRFIEELEGLDLKYFAKLNSKFVLDLILV